MHVHTIENWQHSHRFVDEAATRRGQKKVAWVIALTAVTMVAEIGAGMLFNSMALLADGWHMASHTGALGLALFAYHYSLRHADDRRFTFGTGKVSVLGGYTSAVLLAVVALGMIWESADRLASPLQIAFDEAILVAVVGLIVNLASAAILHGGGEAAQGHDHAHGHSHGGHSHGHAHGGHQDHNMRGAYLHVLTDALTSVLAIAALLAGKWAGWTWLDPIMGIVGALVILKWSWGLLRDTGSVLLDSDVSQHKAEALRAAIEADADNKVSDLHVWRVGTAQLAAIVSVVTHDPQDPEHYKGLLRDHKDIAHLTIEVQRCPGDVCAPPSAS